jgi:hypothetical protein
MIKPFAKALGLSQSTTSLERSISYTKGIFVLLDVLGFKNMVTKAEEDSSQIREIYSLLQDSHRWVRALSNPKQKRAKSVKLLDQILSLIQRQPKHSLQLTEHKDHQAFSSHMFSDTITVSCRLHSIEYISEAMVWAARYQFLMLRYKRAFVRGAIVYDNFYDEDDIVFGPAVMQAADLEKDKAIWPRVLVDSSIISEFSQEGAERDIIPIIQWDDESKLFYLDYLGLFFLVFTRIKLSQRVSHMKEDLLDPFQVLEIHRDGVQKLANDAKAEIVLSKREKLRCKYQYLAKYHNRTIEAQMVGAQEQLGLIQELQKMTQAARVAGTAPGDILVEFKTYIENLRKKEAPMDRSTERNRSYAPPPDTLLDIAMLNVDESQFTREAEKLDDIGEFLLLCESSMIQLRKAQGKIRNLKVDEDIP